MEPATVVIDNGTGYTKMGYAGNMDPSYLIPSQIAKAVEKVSLKIISRSLTPFYDFSKEVSARKTSSAIQSSISTSARRPSQSNLLTTSHLFSTRVKSQTGTVLRNSGTSPFTLISDVIQKSTDLS